MQESARRLEYKMTLPYALNIFLGPALFIFIILAECKNKISNDFFLKRNFSILLIISVLALLFDFLFSLMINIVPREWGLSAFFVTDNLYCVIIFLLPIIFSFYDIFFIRRHRSQTFILYIISLCVNIMTGSSQFFWPVMAALLLFDYLFLIYNESRMDNLTGLNNRNSFYEFIGRLLRNKTGESWNIVLIDINNFKTINNIYGYLEGDAVLRMFAQVIRKCVGKSNFIARFGGDEFVLVARADTNVKKIMSDIVEELNEYNNSEKPYSIEISYGVDTFVTDGKRQIDSFLDHLDMLVKKQYEGYPNAGDNYI